MTYMQSLIKMTQKYLFIKQKHTHRFQNHLMVTIGETVAWEGKIGRVGITQHTLLYRLMRNYCIARENLLSGLYEPIWEKRMDILMTTFDIHLTTDTTF